MAAPEYFDNKSREVRPIEIHEHFKGQGAKAVFGKCRYKLTETPQYFSEHLHSHRRLRAGNTAGGGF
jgi:hypothetical protein